MNKPKPKTNKKEKPEVSNDSLLDKFLNRFTAAWHRTIEFERVSKHMGAHNVRATKAYADDRQKAPHNQRKKGMRKRK